MQVRGPLLVGWLFAIIELYTSLGVVDSCPLDIDSDGICGEQLALKPCNTVSDHLCIRQRVGGGGFEVTLCGAFSVRGWWD